MSGRTEKPPALAVGSCHICISHNDGTCHNWVESQTPPILGDNTEMCIWAKLAPTVWIRLCMLFNASFGVLLVRLRCESQSQRTASVRQVRNTASAAWSLERCPVELKMRCFKA